MPGWLLGPICLIALWGSLVMPIVRGCGSRRIETTRTSDPARMTVGRVALTVIPEARKLPGQSNEYWLLD